MNQIQSMKEQDIKYLILKEIIEYNILYIPNILYNSAYISNTKMINRVEYHYIPHTNLRLTHTLLRIY